ncbi:hypothetical protein TNCV_140781 [Trichonephila clavipes]|nr:hypothetical protein TNCV_140781 [Trichonephila clavipes]
MQTINQRHVFARENSNTTAAVAVERNEHYSRLPAKSVPVSFDHLHLFEAMLFHQLTPKSFNHFSTLCIHLVLDLLFLAPSGVWRVILFV